jgi:hypothetical protein
MTVLFLILALSTKHLIIDFFLQGEYQWRNKGTYGHPGGLLHAGLHGVGTFICFYSVAPQAAIYLALIDAIVHYHLDWAKMNINAKMGWAANTHSQFWYMVGLDQYLHMLTYIGLVYLVT